MDDEAYDQDTPMFDDEIDLIGAAIINYGCVCPFEDAQKEGIVALSKGQLQEPQDRSSGVEFFEREEVLRLWPDPRWEILRSLNTADCAEPPAGNHGGERRKATISAAPKRGRAHRYDWASFDGAADGLFRNNPAATLGDATRTMTEWAGREWGGPDGPGEPAISLIRERLAYHPGAPWLTLTDRQLCVIRELRKEVSKTKKRDFSTRDFSSLCDRSGVVDPTKPKGSQRRLKSDLKMQLANKGLITVVDGWIQLARPKRRPST